MTSVTLSSATTTNTVTITSSNSSTAGSVTDPTTAQSSTSVTSTMPLQSKSTVNKDMKKRPRKIHNFDDYLVYILKWPVTLLDELGLQQK